MGECLVSDRQDPGEHLHPQERAVLLRVARGAIEAYVRGQPLPDLPEVGRYPRLRERRAVFVTLRVEGKLRGCVGCSAHRSPLIQAVQDNAIHAASRDPRFAPLEEDESASLCIEISVLSRGDAPDRPFIRLEDPAQLEIGRDGLYIEHCNGRTGLLLPQVPVEQGWDREAFLAGICVKAGVPAEAWRGPGVRLYRFTAEVFGETEALRA